MLDLSAAVDVYSDWVDACDVVARDTATKYEEDDPRSIRLSDHPVPTEQQLDTIPDANTHGDTYTDSY